ncbi:cbb3-type cytochrome oxidase assembly protein CcoS [Reichenbachiella sp. MALMAid0571]|uniref:cbb3-type cytochrome oxidase assembly protein CcoS n=1 Tax=Reichenbachiella sp. MALMAid0571 TaxID=3143939 RepID=UPI0032DF44B9
MSVIIILIGISILVASAFLISFIWAMKDGQYDDTYSPSIRMLFEDEVKETKSEKRDKNKKQS